MHFSNDPLRSLRRLTGLAALTLLCVSPFYLTGCMSPEDKAFYGRGWLNPSELDEEPPPPRSFTDPTAVSPEMLGPGDY